MMNKRTLIFFLAFSMAVGIVQSSGAHTNSRQIQLTYTTRVLVENREGVLRLWIPLARTRQGQQILSRKIRAQSGLKYEIQTENVFGNQMAYFELESPLPEWVDVSVDYLARIDSSLSVLLPEDHADERYLKPSRLMVINDEVRQIASKAEQDVFLGVKEQARQLYDYVIENMSYDKQVPGFGVGDTARACRVGKGNCTDFHSLLVSSLIASQIPARFQIGFTVPDAAEGTIAGYHCWAQYYQPDEGWKTVDASEAWKAPEKKDFYFNGFDENKFLLTVGRDVNLVPPQDGEALNFLFYPYAELDGTKYDGIATEFTYKNIS